MRLTKPLFFIYNLFIALFILFFITLNAIITGITILVIIFTIFYLTGVLTYKTGLLNNLFPNGILVHLDYMYGGCLVIVSILFSIAVIFGIFLLLRDIAKYLIDKVIEIWNKS